MRTLRLSAEALIAAVVLNAMVFTLGATHLAWIPTVAGIAILLVLFAFDRGQGRSFAESVAYGASCGFVLATAVLYPLTQYLPEFAHPLDTLTGRPLLPAIWLGGTVAFLTADRVRNNSSPVALRVSAIPAVQAPVSEREAPAAISAPEPSHPPPRAAIPQAAIEVKPQPAPKGKPAAIHVNIVGAGIACLRVVQAEHLGSGFYRIVEPVPAGEQWEFSTGQIVRCRKQSLSSGKGLVAFEEAPRVDQA